MPATEFGPWRPLSVDEVCVAMSSFPARWWFTGGIALELSVGRSWRTHDDLDVGICRKDVHFLSLLPPTWELHVAADGKLRPWDGEELDLERHEDNVWIKENGVWILDVTIGEGADDMWTYHRDSRLRVSWDRVVLRSSYGAPYLAPEVQLLFKSDSVRPKDQHDAEVVIPMLGSAAQEFLLRWLPVGHSWSALCTS
jgi:hypothetical protein